MSQAEDSLAEHSSDQLDDLFGSSDNGGEEGSHDMEVDRIEEEPTMEEKQDEEMKPAADEETSDGEHGKELNLAIFGDEESDEEDRLDRSIQDQDDEMEVEKPPAKKKKSKNVLGKKEISLSNCVKLETVNLKPYLLKLPGFIAVEEEEYAPERLESEELALLDVDEDGKYRKDGLLRLSTSIRWRQNPMTEKIESNARLVKWSDGSTSLCIGGEHQFEVMTQNIQKENSYLYCRHAKEGCMEAVGKVDDRFAVRPFVTADQSHRRFLALSTATPSGQASGREAAKVRMAVTVSDPEREKQRMVKLEQEKIKSKRKVEARRRNLQSRSYERVARTGLSAKFLEEDEGEEGEDEDRYEDDFIDDTENTHNDDEEEEEEDTDYKSGDEDVEVGEEEEDGSEDEESTAQESEAESSESEQETRKSKSKKASKSTATGRKATKIIDSDDE